MAGATASRTMQSTLLSVFFVNGIFDAGPTDETVVITYSDEIVETTDATEATSHKHSEEKAPGSGRRPKVKRNHFG